MEIVVRLNGKTVIRKIPEGNLIVEINIRTSDEKPKETTQE